MTARLAGRKVLVVGAGTRASDDPDAQYTAGGPAPTLVGNGRAISVLAAREGAAVACADLDEAAATETAELVAAEGATAVEIAGDVEDPDSCLAIVEAAERELGGLDGLVCNVGIAAGMGLGGTTVEHWDHVFAVNTRAHFLLCQAAVPRMPEGGSIVLVSSVAGLLPGSRIPAYDASKAALAGLNRHVAAEGARRGIRSNVVAPGLIDTPLGRLATQGRPSRARTPVPLGRHGTAWEVAAAVTFLLSHDASYITGQILPVDGGLTFA